MNACDVIILLRSFVKKQMRLRSGWGSDGHVYKQCVARLGRFLETKRGITPNHWTDLGHGLVALQQMNAAWGPSLMAVPARWNTHLVHFSNRGVQEIGIARVVEVFRMIIQHCRARGHQGRQRGTTALPTHPGGQLCMHACVIILLKANNGSGDGRRSS